MTMFILIMISNSIISFFLGWIIRKRKFHHETAVQVIDNLRETIKIYEDTHEENKGFLKQINTNLKRDVSKCYEENRLLEKEINQLKIIKP